MWRKPNKTFACFIPIILQIASIFVILYIETKNLKTHTVKNSILVLLFVILSVVTVKAQNLTTTQKQELDKYNALYSSYKEQGNKNQMMQYLIKIGNIYWAANKFTDAVSTFEQALPLARESGSKNGEIHITNILSNLYQDINQNDKALGHSTTCLQLSKSTGNKENIVSALINIAGLEVNMKKFPEAITHLNEALTIANELNNYKMMKRIYSLFTEAYEKNGDTNKSREYYEMFKAIDNKLKEVEIKKVKDDAEVEVAVANAQKKAKELENIILSKEKQSAVDSLAKVEEENRKNAMEIELLNKDKELSEIKTKEKEAKLERNQAVISSLLFVLILIVVFAGIMLKMFRDKRKAYGLLEQKNVELHEKNEHIAFQHMQLQQKNEEIALSNSRITESIEYARRIQMAILPSEIAISKAFPDSFIYWNPRDIVSGDFYWFAQHNNFTFIAAVDCTGHSVPGAFMSMIGNTLLNEIINEKHIFDPALALEKLNDGILAILNQKSANTFDSADDGMDITLCRFDSEKNELTFAAANHYVFIIDNDKMKMIEGDIFSIGGQWSNRNDIVFNNHVIQLTNQMVIYMFSDGYHDQLGSSETGHKKFMLERFKQQLLDIHKLPMKQQETILKQNLDEWRGDHRQVDDILVIGLRYGS